MPPQGNTDQAAPTPVPASAPTPTSSPVNQNKTMAVLSYLGILVFIPLFTSKNDPYVKFHVKQGLVLFTIEVIMMILANITYSFWNLFQIIHFATLILAIVGIINAVKGVEKELPIVGGFAKHFKV